MILFFRRVRCRVRCIAQTIERYPTVSKWMLLSVIILGGYTIFHREGPKRTNQKIIKKLRNGSNPRSFQYQHRVLVDRSDVIKEIQKLLFESDLENGKFGVILGPAGTGKTRVVVDACSNTDHGPGYILYQEVYSTSEAAKQLAQAADIPLSRTSFDNVYRYLGFESLFYFPSDHVEAMTYVLNKVARRSLEVIEKDNLTRLPCFVIDGAELLAVHEPDVLCTLLRLAQYHVCAKALRVVLVDSNGITLSKINQSLKLPIVDIVEVKDLKDHDAEEYLVKQTYHEMSSGLAKRLVGLIGGRLLHLGCAVDVYQKLDRSLSEDLVYDRIKEHLFIKVIVPIKNVIIENAPVSELIIKCFISNNSQPLFPSQLKNDLRHKDIVPAEAQKIIDALVNANLLRYNANGQLVWHGRFVEAEIKAQYSK